MSNKIGIASLVMLPLFIPVMHAAVTNCNPRFSTEEIDYVVTELVLTPEFEAKELTVSEELAEEGFRRRLLSSQRSREFE
jgi:hypothetical protein